MQYFLQSSSKAKKTSEGPSFNDQLISSAVTSLCISLYHKKNILELDDRQLTELLKQVRYRFSADPAQIARVTGLSYEATTSHLDTF